MDDKIRLTRVKVSFIWHLDYSNYLDVFLTLVASTSLFKIRVRPQPHNVTLNIFHYRQNICRRHSADMFC